MRRPAERSGMHELCPDKGGMESMELSHEPVPDRDGGTEVVPQWPQEHAAVDPYRYPGY